MAREPGGRHELGARADSPVTFEAQRGLNAAHTWSAVPYGDVALPSILELLRICLGSNGQSRSESAWVWKHLANPFGASYGLCARDSGDGSILGLRMLMEWRLADASGKTIRALRAVDTAVHPDYRQRRIFSSLTSRSAEVAAKEGCELIFNTPNAISRAGYLKLGWEPMQACRLKFKAKDREKFEAARQGMLRPPSDGSIEWPVQADFIQMPWNDLSARFSQDLDKLLRRSWNSRRSRSYATPKDLAYLEWHYGRHPHLDYRAVPLAGPDGLAALGVLRLNRRANLVEGLISEIFTAGNDIESARALLDLMSRIDGIDYLVAYHAPGTSQDAALDQAGFYHLSGEQIGVIGRRIGARLGDAGKLPLELSMGDVEIF